MSGEGGVEVSGSLHPAPTLTSVAPDSVQFLLEIIMQYLFVAFSAVQQTPWTHYVFSTCRIFPSYPSPLRTPGLILQYSLSLDLLRLCGN